MKDLILSFIILFSFTSCTTSQDGDSDNMIGNETMSEQIIDSLVANTYEDTTGMHACPVKIISYKLVGMEYSNRKNIYIKYKNTDSKNIEGIRFSWTGVDVFGKKAYMGSSFNGVGGGFADELLKSGKTKSGTWNIYSNNAKKITSIKITEIAFSDGSKWILKNN